LLYEYDDRPLLTPQFVTEVTWTLPWIL